MKTYKKGISLIVLVVTIIVMAILASAVIISLSNANIIGQATETVVKQDFRGFQEELELYISDQTLVSWRDEKEVYDRTTLHIPATGDDTLYTVLPSLKDSKYDGYISIVDGKISIADTMPNRDIAISVVGSPVVTEPEEPEDEPEVITIYTQDDIDNSEGKLVAIGNDDNGGLSVVAKFNDDFTELTIAKNGSSSEGIVADDSFGSNSNKTTVTSIEIKDGITSLGDSVFSEFSALTSVVIPSGVTSISLQAFYGCTSLQSINIPDGVTSIGFGAFMYSGLNSITIPASVTSIGAEAFMYSTVFSINFGGTKEQWNAITFGSDWNGYTSGITIHCTDGDIAIS